MYVVLIFFFSSRRRHTRCALVTGVQTCALPIWDIRKREGLRRVFGKYAIGGVIHFAGMKAVGESVEKPLAYYDNNVWGSVALAEVMTEFDVKRSEERRVGKECVSTCRSRWSPYH